jgi:UDP-N-acetylmuramate dehydrogenase
VVGGIFEDGSFVAGSSELSALGIEVRQGVSLAPLTTMKIGGEAEYFAVATDIEQLTVLGRWAQRSQIPYFILGGGSNILISDTGIRGLVIYNRSRMVRLIKPNADDLNADEPVTDGPAPKIGPAVYAESGAAMAGVARLCIRAAMAGLEWAVSVPGTIGGAVIGNAGAHGGEIKDNLVVAQVLETDGRLVERSVAELDYAYRSSLLKRNRPLHAATYPIVLAATFGLVAGDPVALKQLADRYLAHRRSTQPVEPSLGSTFKNPTGDHAGRLIEAAGLKGKRIGGVEVSRTHANFFINPGGVGAATAADMMALIEYVQAEVERQSGIRLQPEVQLAGDW